MQRESTFLKRLADLSPAKQALLEKRLRDERQQEGDRTTDIPRRAREEVAPLSFTQQRLWFMQQLEPESAVYNEVVAIRLSGPLHVEALTQAVREIVRRHEVLRSSYPTIDGQAQQLIDPSVHEHVRIELIDLQDVPVGEREAAARQRIDQEVQRPFHLGQEVPWRRLLLRLDEQEHIALMVMHHIITDAWSMEVFVGELTTLYAAFSTGEASPLPEIPVQYADYACWQRQQIEKEKLARQRAYWKRQLSGTLPVLELPTDSPRPAVQTFHGRRHPVVINPSLSQALQALGQQEGVTLFMTLLAAFQVVLYRYSEQEDLLVGSPIANRTRPELEQLLGCFVNTLVLRTDLSGNPAFRDLLQRVRKVTLGAYERQDMPFEKVVEDVQPARSLSHATLFQVMFVLQNVPLAAQELAGLTISPVEIEHTTAKFELSLCLRESVQGLSGYLEYNTDLFEGSTIERFVGHFLTVLEAVVADPGQRIADLSLLTEAELHYLADWNATQRAYPKDHCLHEWIEAQVERMPEAVAIIFEQERLTYRELNARANQLAHHLQRRGVGPEVLVGVSMERSVELVVALLAILKAGGAYVPLDPGYPPERLAFLLHDAQVSVLLTQEHLRSRLPAHETHVLAVDSAWERIAQEPTVNLHSGVKPNNLAYLIYTSGSTGKPKGAMNNHQAICNRLLWMQETYQLQPSDRVLQKTPSSFDVSVWEFFWPLLAGARLIVARPEGHRDSQYLIELIREAGITVLHFVPSMLRLFLGESEGERRLSVESLESLRLLICSGEALTAEVQARCFERLPQVEFHNLYGPTEAAVDVTSWRCERQNGRRVVPIGRPIANIQMYVLDGHLKHVPVGVPGELYIGGVGVGRGYHQRPELTAEKFVPDPFGCAAGGRLYKTGDVGRYLVDGSIEYLGRNDHQVKIRGFRIELEEIEAVLSQYPGVKECVVLARDWAPGDKRLVAYIVAQPGWSMTSVELRQKAKEVLPEYMVPSSMVFLDALPLSPNDKLDRQALPSPGRNQAIIEETPVAPVGTPIEAELAAIWSHLLDVERVGIHDNFFEMGGHSLLVTQAVARIRDAFGVELPLRVLFKTSTVAELAQAIERVKARSEELRKPTVAAVSREGYRLKRTALTEVTGGAQAEREG
jgi:amino acid adenylation domain-containing protein